LRAQATPTLGEFDGRKPVVYATCVAGPPQEPEIEGLQLVLAGSFNPTIFQPAWFAAQGILKPREAENVDLGLIHPQVTDFRTDRFSIQVQPGRFVGLCDDPRNHEPLLDAVVGAFRVLHHTPVVALGINVDLHFDFGSKDACRRLGTELVPTAAWERVGLHVEMHDVAVHAKRPDGRRGHIQVRVQPSARLPAGVYVQVNDHYDLSGEPEPRDAVAALAILENDWADSVQRSRSIAHDLVRTAQ
jgi:hypothetical protein